MTDFFPFGVTSGDTEGVRGIDEFTGPINITIPIVFNARNHSKMLVSCSGYKVTIIRATLFDQRCIVDISGMCEYKHFM